MEDIVPSFSSSCATRQARMVPKCRTKRGWNTAGLTVMLHG